MKLRLLSTFALLRVALAALFSSIPSLLPGADPAAPGASADNKESGTAMPSAFIVAQPVSTYLSDTANASWDEIKEYAYEKRVEFGAGLRKLEAKVDMQVDELNAKRQVMKADPRNWDFAMKEMIEAQAYLKSMAAEARKATEETWDDRKEKVRLAWERAQEAYGKVKASTTS